MTSKDRTHPLPMISVIIPAYNEEKALPQTLDNVFTQTGHFEVILVDGGSTDKTVEIAHRDARVKIISAPKGRASQMNAGAAEAQGEWLLFLHADTSLPERGLLAIASLSNDILAGSFRQSFSGDKWALRLISWMHNLRCRMTRIMYGDQAMFIRRSFFRVIGEFPDQPILEDVSISAKIVRFTKPVLLQHTVVTDARKFTTQGIWRSFWRLAVILTCVEAGRSIPRKAMRFFHDTR